MSLVEVLANVVWAVTLTDPAPANGSDQLAWTAGRASSGQCFELGGHQDLGLDGGRVGWRGVAQVDGHVDQGVSPLVTGLVAGHPDQMGDLCDGAVGQGVQSPPIWDGLALRLRPQLVDHPTLDEPEPRR